MERFTALAQRAKAASRLLAQTDAGTRERALRLQAELTEEDIRLVLDANRADLDAAEPTLDAVRRRIMTLREADLRQLPPLMREMAGRTDLLGQQVCEKHIEEGLELRRCMVPLGVVALLYEARPTVAWEAFALCLRTANALILRCSPYDIRTTEALVALFRRRLAEAGLPEDAVQCAAGGAQEDTYALFRMERYVDAGIVRGNYGTLRDMKREATVPLAVCGPGNCHIFIDESADPRMAEDILISSKVDRPLACNAAETLLVHERWAERHLAQLLNTLRERGLTFAGDARAAAYGEMDAATEEDWAYEYFAPRLAVAIVPDIGCAIDHINCYRTPHTECILTEDAANAARFFREVECNACVHNAATRLIDGGVFGFGTEMGISTGKLPWCGPIAARQLVQERFFLSGHGNVRR